MAAQFCTFPFDMMIKDEPSEVTGSTAGKFDSFMPELLGIDKQRELESLSDLLDSYQPLDIEKEVAEAVCGVTPPMPREQCIYLDTTAHLKPQVRGSQKPAAASSSGHNPHMIRHPEIPFSQADIITDNSPHIAGGHCYTFDFPELPGAESGGAYPDTAADSRCRKSPERNNPTPSSCDLSGTPPGSNTQSPAGPRPLSGPQDPSQIRIGSYTLAERAQKIARYREKRKRRCWKKKIKYQCRKDLADTRPRVKGRFVKVPAADWDQKQMGEYFCDDEEDNEDEEDDEDDIE